MRQGEYAVKTVLKLALAGMFLYALPALAEPPAANTYQAQNTAEKIADEAASRVDEVISAKVLRLEDGTRIRLAALQAPNPGQPFYNESIARLRELVMDRPLRIERVSSRPDRRGRVVAMVYNDADEWVQEEMLRAGKGWAYTFPDTADHAQALLSAEAEAEAELRGVWRIADYVVLEAEHAAGNTEKFRLVRGEVMSVNKQKNGRVYINFGEDWKTDFTLVIERRDVSRFDKEWLIGLQGKTIRSRGWLHEQNGPAIALTHPEQIEVLP